MADLTITTEDDLPGPGDDRPYVMFVNQTEYGVGKFLRTNVLSARPDLKRFTSIRFHMTMKRHPSDSAGEIGQLDPIDARQIAGPIPPKLTGTGQAPSTASAASSRSGSGLDSTPSAALRASIRAARASPSRSAPLKTATGR